MKIEDAKTKTAEPVKNETFRPRRLSSFSSLDRSEIVYIDVDKLIPYRNQARKVFNEADIENLAETIKEHGLRQPLTVVKNSPDSLFYEVVSGERRLRACKLNGMSRLPCIVLQDSEKAEEIALIENIQRQDLHPIELSDALALLVHKRNWEQSEIAKKLGMAKSKVSELMKLQHLSIEVREKILRTNVRSREHLRGVTSLLSVDEQCEYLNNIVSNSGYSVGGFNKKEAVIRIFLNGVVASSQSNKILKITEEQRKSVVLELKNILDSLDACY